MTDLNPISFKHGYALESDNMSFSIFLLVLNYHITFGQLQSLLTFRTKLVFCIYFFTRDNLSFHYAAALVDWSLISFINLLIFVAIQITVPQKGMLFYMFSIFYAYLH